jgi:translation initiation factor 1
MGKKKENSLSWDDFVKMGNPDNAPDEPETENDNSGARKSMEVRLHYEKKGRGGKQAVIIRGISETDDNLKNICKELKTKLGVGGSSKEGEIIIQGSDRDKMIDLLKKMGFSSVKKSGG